MNDLSRPRLEELRQRESVIERGLRDAWVQLCEIHDSSLYLETHSTWVSYCEDRWKIASSTAYQLIDAAKVLNDLRNCGEILPILPNNESQARPLARKDLTPTQRREAWSRAVDTTPNGNPTGEHVRSVVDEMFPRREPLNRQGSFLDREEQQEEWTPVPAEQVEKDMEKERARRGAQAWTKILSDYCQHRRSIERMGEDDLARGAEFLVRNWDVGEIDLAAEFTDEAVRFFKDLGTIFRRCIHERNCLGQGTRDLRAACRHEAGD